MKVLFLDMDGVLVTKAPGRVDSRLVDNLRRIIETSGAKIVLSTDWRRDKQARQAVRNILKAHGGMDFISWTTTSYSRFHPNRPLEILAWLADHNAKVDKGEAKGERVDAFVAIDDRPLLEERGGKGLTGHFVQTHPSRGLTAALAERAIQCLEATWDPKKEREGGPASENENQGVALPNISPALGASLNAAIGVARGGGGALGASKVPLRMRPTPGQATVLQARPDLATRVDGTTSHPMKLRLWERDRAANKQGNVLGKA